MRFIIEQGYIQMGIVKNSVEQNKGGWVADEKGSMYAVIKVDDDNKQIGMADAAFSLDDIPQAIRRLMEDKENG